MFNETVYLPGDTLMITDIGSSTYAARFADPGSSLVCISSNVNTQCCRSRDGGNVGEWFFPNGAMVPRNSRSPGSDFTRNGFTQQVRLNRRNNAVAPFGVYTCRIPDGRNSSVIHSANITLLLNGEAFKVNYKNNNQVPCSISIVFAYTTIHNKMKP